MESVVGIFRSAEDARRAAEALAQAGVPRDRLSVLTPVSSETEVHSRVATAETEQPGDFRRGYERGLRHRRGADLR